MVLSVVGAGANSYGFVMWWFYLVIWLLFGHWSCDQFSAGGMAEGAGRAGGHGVLCGSVLTGGAQPWVVGEEEFSCGCADQQPGAAARAWSQPGKKVECNGRRGQWRLVYTESSQVEWPSLMLSCSSSTCTKRCAGTSRVMEPHDSVRGV